MSLIQLFPGLLLSLLVIVFLIFICLHYQRKTTALIRSGVNKYPDLGGSPWSRFWARMIDIFLYVAAIEVIVSLFIKLPDFSSVTASPQASLFLEGLMVTPPALVLDAVLMASTGTTLGKKLFSITICTEDHKRLSFFQALERNFRVWVYGMTLSAPFWNIFALYQNYRKVASNIRTSWDASGNYEVQQGQITFLRKVIAYTIGFSLLALNFVAIVLDRLAK